MHTAAGLAALAATFATASAGAAAGFNYGSTFTTNAPKMQSDFEAEFTTAKNLHGAPVEFTSARLYTMIQAGTASDPISAIPAAIKTQTSILFGLWASAGDAAFANEIKALKAAITQYGKDVKCEGISVGSEDLYRISVQGIENKSGVGVGPTVLTGYIKQVRDAIKGTPLANCPIGHVDTWNAWVNGSNVGVVDDIDWCGVDEYPYFQNTEPNGINVNKQLFNTALDKTQGACKGKPVWVTETGFPVSGKTSGAAVPSVQNAKTYWDQVGCPLFGNTNTWWYTLQDSEPAVQNPSFGIVNATLSPNPIFDLSCKGVNTGSVSSGSSTTMTPSGTATGTASSATSTGSSSSGGSSGTGAGAGSGSGSGSGSSTTSSPSGLPTHSGSGVVAKSGSIGAAFAAVMVAILAL